MAWAKTIEQLIQLAAAEARREPFPVDLPVYEKTGKDPLQPLLYGGSLAATVCVLARDLGRDEVKASEPLIGAGGKLVRAGVVKAWAEIHGRAGELPTADALKHSLLTNTVPFKPPGNKAYPESIRERFRPFVESLLADFWEGSEILTLGNEAFHWFERYAEAGRFDEKARTDERFEAVFPCRLPVRGAGGFKTVRVRPLPHPSPLNRRWRGRFPEMLDRRLKEVWGKS